MKRLCLKVSGRVAHLERAAGAAELLRAVWETDDQRWHGGRALSPGGFESEKPSDAGADRYWQRKLAGDEQPDVVLFDLADDPQLTPVTHEVADFGDGGIGGSPVPIAYVEPAEETRHPPSSAPR